MYLRFAKILLFVCLIMLMACSSEPMRCQDPDDLAVVCRCSPMACRQDTPPVYHPPYKKGM